MTAPDPRLPDLDTWVEEARYALAYPDYNGAVPATQARRVLALAAALEELRAGLTDAIAELVECRSFISVETRHYPTVTAISAKIDTLAALLGESS